MSVDRSNGALGLLWRVAVSPIAGAAVAAAAFSYGAPAFLPGWATETGAIVCGAAGLIAGGMLGSVAADWLQRVRAGAAERHGAEVVPVPVPSDTP